MVNATEGQLRVWWIRNVSGKPEYHPVKDPAEAVEVYERLTADDLKDESVTSNAGGLEVFEDGEWTEWYSEFGEDIDDYILHEGEQDAEAVD